MKDKIAEVQRELSQEGVDGWLFYDFRRSNDLACKFLKIGEHEFLSRRYLYWIPTKGEPIKILHRIEPHILDHMPGKKMEYSSWQELEKFIADVLKGSKKIAMEYSPRNAIPYMSKVDGGTIDLVRSCGVEVVSSANILQKYTSVCTKEQGEMHLEAAKVLDETAAKTWAYIGNQLKQGKKITEYDVQQFMQHEVVSRGFTHHGGYFCCVNGNAANPHYDLTKDHFDEIKKGDFILIDLWCKKKAANSVYADITRVGVAASKPTPKQQEVFNIVRKAQQTGLELVLSRFKQGKAIMGCEIDEATRKVIVDAGYGKYFTHRTGHNMDDEDHGKGAHIDNLETKDFRQILPGMCFTIEPGIYLPGEFGIRLEFDVYVDLHKKVHVTGGIQDEIVCLF